MSSNFRTGRHLARVTGEPDIVIVDRGQLVPNLFFDYEDGGTQGIGIVLGPSGADFIKGVMRAIGVTSWRGLAGRSCWVTTRDGLIARIEPLHARDGVAFDFDEWREKWGLK